MKLVEFLQLLIEHKPNIWFDSVSIGDIKTIEGWYPLTDINVSRNSDKIELIGYANCIVNTPDEEMLLLTRVSQNIIKNPTLLLIINNDSELSVILDMPCTSCHDKLDNGKQTVSIDISAIEKDDPIDMDELINNALVLMGMKASNKVLKWLIGINRPLVGITQEEKQRVDYLKGFGISGLFYIPKYDTKPKEVDGITFSIPSFNILPPVSDVGKRINENKSLTPSHTLLKEKLDYYENESELENSLEYNESYTKKLSLLQDYQSYLWKNFKQQTPTAVNQYEIEKQIGDYKIKVKYNA